MEYNLLSYHAKKYPCYDKIDVEYTVVDDKNAKILRNRYKLIKSILKNASVDVCSKFINYLYRLTKENEEKLFWLSASLIGFFKEVKMEDKISDVK